MPLPKRKKVNSMQNLMDTMSHANEMYESADPNQPESSDEAMRKARKKHMGPKPKTVKLGFE